MHRNNTKRHTSHGLTLVETVGSVAVSALLILVISRMTVGAINTFRSGSGHLTNLLAADIVMSQLLEDLKQAKNILSTDEDLAKGELILERLTWDESGATAGIDTIYYRMTDNRLGVSRTAGGREHVLFPDRTISLEFRRLTVPPRNTVVMLTGLEVGTPPNNREEQGFRRLVYLQSLPENRAAVSAYLPITH